MAATAVAAAAVFMRQTNAVWAAFLLGEAALSEIGMDWAQALRGTQAQAPLQLSTASEQTSAGGGGGGGGAAAAPRQGAAAGAPCWRGDKDGVAAGKGVGAAGKGKVEGGTSGGSVGEVREALQRLWQRRGELAARLWPLLLPPAGFAAFLAANGGSVVLGDKEAHKPVRHGAQLLYFAGWAALMLWPQLLPGLRTLRDAAARRPLAAAATAAAAVAAAAGVAHVSTMVHPYMLADNRWDDRALRSATLCCAAIDVLCCAAMCCAVTG